jgi:hypothetical protein
VPQTYTDPAAVAEERADRHRDTAIQALEAADNPAVALVHALLALDARLDELNWHVAR